MNSFKIAFSNVKKSLKDYMIYFYTLIIGIVMFYSFNSLDNQSLKKALTETQHRELSSMNVILESMNIAVVMVMIFLIIYADNFIMKQRKEEFGLYIMLGMKKKKLAGIIFIEMLIASIICIAAGTIIGIIASQFFSIIVAGMFEADMEKFSFSLSSQAFYKTVCVFFAINILVVIKNIISICSKKIIELINYKKQIQAVRLRNISIYAAGFITAVMLIALSYKLTVNINYFWAGKIMFCMIILIIGTAVLFWSGNGLYVKISNFRSGRYYKDVHLFEVNQEASEITKNSLLKSVICIMLFSGICILTLSVSVVYGTNYSLRSIPQNADIEVELGIQRFEDGGINESVIERMERQDQDIKEKIISSAEMSFYTIDSLNKMNFWEEENPDNKAFKLSEYNKMAEFTGAKKLELDENEYAVVSGNKSSYNKLMNLMLKEQLNLTINDKQYKPKFDKTIKMVYSTYFYQSYADFKPVFVFSDDAPLWNNNVYKKFMLGKYNADSKEEKLNIENQILEKFHAGENEILKKVFAIENGRISTKIRIFDQSVGFGVMCSFIGLYSGIILILACGTVLSLKEMCSRSEDKERFKILNDLGVKKNKINKILFVHIGKFFASPFLIAVLHSIAGISLGKRLTENYGRDILFMPVMICTCIIIILYGSYFMLSYANSKRIIDVK